MKTVASKNSIRSVSADTETKEERAERKAKARAARKREIIANDRALANPSPMKSAMELALDAFEPRPFPTKMDLWRVVVQILQPPEKSAGGIVFVSETTEREEYATYVGYVLDMGPLCYQAVTRSGLDLKSAIKCKVGDWVHFGKHAGEKFRTRDGTLYVVMSDTEILGPVEHPELFDCTLL